MIHHLPVPAPAGDAAPAHIRELFDPCDLGSIERVPLIPEAARRQRHVFVPADAAAQIEPIFCPPAPKESDSPLAALKNWKG